jgi:antitoxin component of RelBE/YafQ-DinJ toxin-antitoxin module
MTVNLVIKISSDMRRQARAVAAMRGETISDVVRAALAKYIQDSVKVPYRIEYSWSRNRARQ